jgi:predicted Zn-dependent peptidase
MAEITTTTLDCGATLVVEKNLTMRSLAARFLVPVGDAHDPETIEGRAPMWAELLLRGAGTLDSRAQADAFDLLGAMRSAENSRLHTRLSSTMLADRFARVAPLLVDTLRRPRFDESSVTAARELCLQSLASLADEPQERAVLAARARHYPSPLNRSGMGTEAGLRALTRERLVSDWGAFAQPKGTIIALAGNIDAAEAAGTLNGLLEGWAGEVAPRDDGPAAPRGYAHEHDDSSQVQIVVVHDAPREPSDEVVLERILVSVLSGGMSSRLFTEVREKRGLCYSVNASYAPSKETGTVTAYVGTTPERAQESLDVLVAELNRINGEAPITEEEFRRAVNGIKSRIVFSGESTAARAGALAADLHNRGRARSLDEIAEAVDKVSLDALNAYAASRTLGTLTIQTLGPSELCPPA